MVINTSFNVRGEPPVCSPEDAVRCFLATDMDVLVMENTMLLKEQQADEAIKQAKQVTFELD
jgi:carbamoyltransferase